MDRELNKQQIEEFFDTGFTTAEQFFDEREMEEISSGFDRLLEIAEEIVRVPDFNPDDAHNIEYDGSYSTSSAPTWRQRGSKSAR